MQYTVYTIRYSRVRHLVARIIKVVEKEYMQYTIEQSGAYGSYNTRELANTTEKGSATFFTIVMESRLLYF